MAGQLTTTRPTFPQQGQVDWVALSSSTVNFSVGLLARLMKADIHPSTLTFGMALCSSFRLAPQVQNNVKECIDRLKRYGACNNILWFGFGIKQTVVELASSEEGLSFVTLCSSILTSYDTYYTAQVLRKLGDIHSIPRDFTPSISQWESIIKSFSGIFIGSRFDLVLQSMRRLVYGSPCDVSKRNCDPGTVAKVLGELALIQSERTAYLTVTGGADCTWFATFAEHVLCLDVAIIDQSGSPIYRSKERKDVMPQITFLTNPEGEPSLHVSQRTSLVSINLRIIRTEAQAPIAMYFCQRSSWSTILRDTFGDDIEKWLTGDFSQYLCISLAFHGSASIIQEWIDSYVDENIEHYVALRKWLGGSSKIELPDVSRELAELLGIPSGEAFVEKAGSILPELRPAIQKHRHKYNLDLGEKLHSLSLEIPEEQFLEQFLLDRYLMTVAVYIKIMMLCEIADDVAPTISGISALYRTISRNMFSDQVNLNHVLSLFTDGISLDVKPQSVTLASCSHGICVHRNGLYDPTEDVPGIATFRVLRGQIVHENNVYTEIFDIERSFERSDEDELWAFESYRYEPKDTHRAVDMLLRQSALNHKLEVGFKVYHEILGAGGTTKHNYLIRLGEMIYDIEHELYFQRSNACKGSHRFATSWAGDPRYPALFEDGMILWLDFEENSVLSSLPNFSRDGKRLYAFIEFGSLIREESGSFGAETANCFFGSYLDIHLLRQYKSRDSARFKSICTSNHNCIACYLGTMNIPLPGFKILLDNMSDDRRSNIFEFPNTFRILGLEGGEKQIRWTAKAERAPEEYQAFLRYRHVDREMLEAITGNKTTL